MKNSNTQAFGVAIFTLAVGVALGASGILGLIEVAQEHPAVSRCLLGYTLIWCGVMGLVQHSMKRAMIAAVHSLTSQAGSKSELDSQDAV